MDLQPYFIPLAIGVMSDFAIVLAYAAIVTREP